MGRTVKRSDIVGLLIAAVVLYDGETTGSVLKWYWLTCNLACD